MTSDDAPARIGPYEVIREIGRGGMGVVHLARDTTLEREVAIKTLPDELAEHPDRLTRFEREARALASLSHPNIGAIYGIEEVDGKRHLVLEYIPGETLADLLEGGPMPVGEALSTAKQIAEALEAAHERGIIHRDLKPDNVKITPEGRVKVLDFGLAKRGETRSETDFAKAETTPRSPTEPGMVLGTAPYMSPEQARGRHLDKRSDIWSFGVLLYEMLTGVGPFLGETSVDSIGAILHKDVDFDRLPPATPAIVRHLLTLCLQRKRDDRLHDIADARIELQRAIANPGELVADHAPAGPSRPTAKFAFGGLGAALGAIAVALALRPEPPAPPPARRFELAPFEDLGRAVISPDGSMLALLAAGSLHVRDMATGEIRKLHGSADGFINSATWSPDNAWIGFGSSSGLHRIRASGGAAVPITDDAGVMMSDAAWTDDGALAVCRFEGGLDRIDVESGRSTTWLPADPNEIHLHPGGTLPDALGVMFVPHPKDGDARVLCLATPAGERKVLFESEHELNGPVYSPTGHIVYTQSSTPKGVWAVPFSLDALAVTGDAFYIGPGVGVSASARGDLVFLSRWREDDRPSQLTWIDREGKTLEVVGPKMYSVNPGVRLSPDGTKAVVAAKGRDAASASRDTELWIVDLVRSTATAVTDEGGDYFGQPLWSSDGKRIAYPLSTGLSFAGVYVRNADGTGDRELLLADAGFPSLDEDWSVAVMNAGSSFFDAHIVTERVGEPASREVFQDSPEVDLVPLLRPGGGLVAYTSGNISNQETEVFLRPFPSGAGRWQVSTAGGMGLAWSREGDRFFYGTRIDPRGMELHEVPVALGADGEVELGQPVKLFEFPEFLGGLEVAPGSERFLVLRPEETEDGDAESPQIVVLVENWLSSFAGERR